MAVEFCLSREGFPVFMSFVVERRKKKFVSAIGDSLSPGRIDESTGCYVLSPLILWIYIGFHVVFFAN